MRVRFVQIACTAQFDVFGLDDKGRVWRYFAHRPGKENGGKGRYAFWSKLTDYGSDPADPKYTPDDEVVQ